MLDYSQIQNEHLRELLIHSESINAQDEINAQAVINNIAALGPVQQQEVIQMLEEEQKQIQSSKIAKGITPDVEVAAIEKNRGKLTEIKHEYDTNVRKYEEGKTQKQDEAAAEDLLNQLNN